MVSLIIFAILGYLLGFCCICIWVIEQQDKAIQLAKIRMNDLRRENESLFKQHLKDNGISINETSNYEH